MTRGSHLGDTHSKLLESTALDVTPSSTTKDLDTSNKFVGKNKILAFEKDISMDSNLPLCNITMQDMYPHKEEREFLRRTFFKEPEEESKGDISFAQYIRNVH